MYIHSNHGLTRGVSRLGQSLRAAPVGEPLEINVLVAFHFHSSELRVDSASRDSDPGILMVEMKKT